MVKTNNIPQTVPNYTLSEVGQEATYRYYSIYMTFSITRERRRWEAFPGKNSFCCDGRCICARSLLAFYSTLVMIVVPSLLFFGFECRFLTILLSPAIPVVAALLLIFVLVNLFFACCTDPGILPRATYDESHWLMTQIGSSSGELESSPPRVKEVMINNRVIKLKYCYTCKIFRPPRTSHCSSCDCCVERFDHHCPWVGNCVGRRNYRYFFMFVSSLTLYCGFLLACTITNFVMLGLKNDFVYALKNCPLSIVILLSSFFGMWAVGGIASYHLSLIAREVSTNEAIKGSYNDKQCGRSSNPFNRGNFVGNMIWILCGPLYPSFIYLREPLDGDELPQVSRQLIPLEDGRGYCHPILSSSARKPAISHGTTPLPPYVPPLPATTAAGPSQPPVTTEQTERRESSISSSGYSADIRSALVTSSVNV